MPFNQKLQKFNAKINTVTMMSFGFDPYRSGCGPSQWQSE